MMTAIRNNWITGLTLLTVVFLVATGIGMVLTGGEFDEDGIRIYGAAGGVGAVSTLAGLWGLRTGRLERWLAKTLIVIGVAWFGVGFWWFVLVPPVIALAVLYAGVFKRGLERELSPA